MPNRFTFSLDRPDEALFTLTATYTLDEWAELLDELAKLKRQPFIVHHLRDEIYKLQRDAHHKWVGTEEE